MDNGKRLEMTVFHTMDICYRGKDAKISMLVVEW